MKKVILAPDIYVEEAEPLQDDIIYISSDEEDIYVEEAEPLQDDIIYISSDEEDFEEKPKEWDKKSPKRSPKSEKHKTPTKLMMESFFAQPKSPLNSSKRKRLSSKTPKSCSDMNETRLNVGDPLDISIKFEPSQLGHETLRLGSTSMQHMGQRTADEGIIGNTSLNEQFDKTYGDFETTAMLNKSTFDAKDAEEDDESDEDLDTLLLEGVGDAMLNPTPDVHAVSSSNSETKNPDVKESVPILNETRRPGKLFCEDSFDVLPKKIKEKNFKYQKVVRKRNERDKLDAKPCKQCEAYYSDLSGEERKEVLRKTCRHKYVFPRPSTPEHFWDTGIPDTEECKRRGYFTDEKDLPPEERNKSPRFRRRKPLEPYFSKKR